MPLLPDTDTDTDIDTEVDEGGPRPAHPDAGHTANRTRISALTPRILDDWTFSFFAQLHLEPDTTHVLTHAEGRHITTLRTPDGRATTVTETDGGAEVVWSGRGDPWAPIERAHRLWLELNRPRREWFTLEVRSSGQHVRLAAPDGRAYTWTL
ncbi:hypothetical protein ACWGR4_47880 [Embleya sp. NPDC055664]